MNSSLSKVFRRLTEYSVGGTNPIPILVQSGYLTIKGYDSRFDTYHLELPNEEVKYGFLNFLSPDFIGTKSFSFDSDFDVRKFVILTMDFTCFLVFSYHIHKQIFKIISLL